MEIDKLISGVITEKVVPKMGEILSKIPVKPAKVLNLFSS
jgi:hypothetical protein